MIIRDPTMNKHYYNNLAHACMFGVPLIWDFSFEEHMTGRELRNLSKQMVYVHGHNKKHREPFHLIFSNVHPGKVMDQHCQKDDFKDLPYTVTEKSPFELYPKEKLVYLSPNAPKVLERFDTNDIYIVGGIVDKAIEEPITYATAKRHGIRSAKLPLDQYVEWVLVIVMLFKSVWNWHCIFFLRTHIIGDFKLNV